jgi:hypothetical protein
MMRPRNPHHCSALAIIVNKYKWGLGVLFRNGDLSVINRLSNKNTSLIVNEHKWGLGFFFLSSAQAIIVNKYKWGLGVLFRI